MLCKDCGRELEAKIAPGDLLCPDCRRNRIEKQKLKVLQEQERRLEREKKERKLEEWNRKQKEDLDEMRREREARQQKCEQEQHEQARVVKEEVDRLLGIIESHRIQQQRYEDEQREINAREWAERQNYLDHLSNEEIKRLFENSEFQFTGERDYLESRYRRCITKEEELEFIKDKEKFLAKKKIKNGIESFSFDETLIYSFISSIDARWFEEIIERENYLKNFPQFNFKIATELENDYRCATNSKQRQEIIGLNGFVIRFKNKSSLDRQIFFREYIQNECKNIFDETYTFDNALGLFWGIGPILNKENDDAIRLFWNSDKFKFSRAKTAYSHFSKIEPLYIEALNENEKEDYLEKKKSAEKEGEEFLKNQLQKDKEEREIRQKQREEFQQEFNEKKKESDKLIEECNEIDKRRKGRPQLYEKEKKSRKKTISVGCITQFVILFIIGTFIPSNNRAMVLSAAAVMLVVFVFALIRIILLSIKMKKILKEDAKDDAAQNENVDKNKQLVARLNELQRLLKE